ncbi:MAG: hypothetical protein P1U64_02055 [Alcanivoracaceae bacterium]|jgi:predicted small lipoprotein YifL|nr:hypothetical protein [Alcanivoracaceae bacterium]
MKTLIQMITVVLFSSAIAACGDDPQSPAEKAQQEMEQTADIAGEAMEDAGDDIEGVHDNTGPMEAAGEAIDEGVSEAVDTMNEMEHEAKQALEESGDDM